MKGQSTGREKWPARAAWLLGGLTASMLAGSMTAKGAAVSACITEEHVEMIDPVVTVIEGPGDPMEEQFNWSFLNRSFLFGPREIVLGETGFKLEKAP
jgi:hypothetical protein